MQAGLPAAVEFCLTVSCFAGALRAAVSSCTHWNLAFGEAGAFIDAGARDPQPCGSGRPQSGEEIMRKTALVLGLLAAVTAWPMAPGAPPVKAQFRRAAPGPPLPPTRQGTPPG